MNLRNEARGRECRIRLVGICNHDPETTSLAHLRMAGITGVGMKAPDLLGAWACSECARATENGYEADEATQIAFFEGVMRTQAQLIREGKVKW